MDKFRAEPATTFSQPIRQLVFMLVVVVLVATGAWVIHAQVAGIFQTNPLLNGFIAGVFFLGVLTCFWQVFILMQSVSWIEDFVRHIPGHENTRPPRLLAPLASLLRSRGKKMQISNSSSRSILESVATRIDEARDITRYLTNLLIFLGLLGTFYGLATTVPAVVETIRSLAPQEGETGIQVFTKLMGGLENQLGGMGTAFSSSLLGLAGSLVVGLLELFAGHGQNRFYRELEEWLSSITRVSLASDGEGGDSNAMAAVVDQMAAQMDALQSLYTQSDITRVMVEDKIDDLARAITKLAERMEAETGQAAALNRIAEGQDRLVAALTGAEGGAHSDAESRMRLRSIDVQLLRILEEISAGRQESTADLRGDIAALTAAIRTLSRGTVGRG
ncbi:biopolymer transporter ExbB [Paragemmobacter straminiformis]|uniref:Biopolymer transporter ExbB n=1 Tax=Paragemmobacter straminiformis TaxID=2045119 RepID=A0A842I5H4_9RHOB|nr:biopolymer transporter ExbB [Gemmobacter straminiformis]MBC2834886.1 biopolymer transporter ExbB [Gemmobacter straminiformis]